ncbi:MAG: HD domain-containing protein [Lentimicrobiaceae bacterium]|nr:HD domain-containing protein [Lentimicrobiaceae bacterium]
MPGINQSERELIINSYRALLEVTEPLLDRDKSRHLKAAFIIMLNAHQRSLYADTEPYFLHSVAVARIVARDMGMGFTSVLASLLAGASPGNKEINEFITTYNYKQLGVILNKLEVLLQLPTEKVPTNAEHFISLVLSLADDIRVIPILLADRLQYMRNIKVLPANVQASIASQTANLYAPLAHRLGLYRINAELDELSLNYTDPDTYQQLKSQINKIESKEAAFFESFLQPVHAELKRFGLQYEIKKRTKSISSVYKKMQTQRIALNEVYDLFAIRIILDSKPDEEQADCWKAYTAVTSVYAPEPKRLRDWITLPRRNGYESLHITVQGKDGRWVEVQIRTSRMDFNAEMGNSAHWRYKGSEGDQETSEWLNSIRQVLEHPEGLDSNLPNKYSDKANATIYVFTPEGDVKKLKSGSTVLDLPFKYIPTWVHTVQEEG